MQDLKTGALLRASPRSQFYGQMIGSFASIFVSTAAYKLYKSVYEIPGPAFRVPTAAIWCVLVLPADGSRAVLRSLTRRLHGSQGSTSPACSTPATYLTRRRCSWSCLASSFPPRR